MLPLSSYMVIWGGNGKGGSATLHILLLKVVGKTFISYGSVGSNIKKLKSPHVTQHYVTSGLHITILLCNNHFLWWWSRQYPYYILLLKTFVIHVPFYEQNRL